MLICIIFYLCSIATSFIFSKSTDRTFQLKLTRQNAFSAANNYTTILGYVVNLMNKFYFPLKTNYLD